MSQLRSRTRSSHRLAGTALVATILLLGAMPALAEMVTGTYTGDGAFGREITGLGFEPVVVIVKSDDNDGAVIRTASMPTWYSRHLIGDWGLMLNRITWLSADGFFLGDDWDVNADGTTYFYIAFSEDPGQLALDSYTGNDDNDRLISVPDLDPGLVILIPEGASRARFRTSTMRSNRSARFDDVNLEDNSIVDLVPNGFIVDRDRANRSGEDYYYLAFAENLISMRVGSYTGNGNSGRPIEDVGFRPRWLLTRQDGNKRAAHITEELAGLDRTLSFMDDASWSGGIFDFTDTGFILGNSNRTNEDNHDYDWVAFANPADVTADIAVSLVVNDATPELGDVITMNAVIANLGPAEATGANLQVDVPAGLALQTLTADPGLTGDGSTPEHIDLTWTIPAGEQRQVTATYLVELGDRARAFAARGSSTQADDNPANDQATFDLVIPTADLDVTLDASNLSPSPGETIQLTVDLVNNGPDGATALSTMVTIPAGLTVIGSTPSLGSFDVGSGEWFIASLPTTGAGTLVIDATVGLGEGGNVLAVETTTASLRNDDFLDNNRANVNLSVGGGSDLEVTIDTTPSEALPGEAVVYNVTVTNNGPDSAALFDAAVTLPPEVSYVGYTADFGTYNHLTGQWMYSSSFDVGTVATLAIDVLVASDDAAVVQGAASVAGAGLDPVPANNTSTVDLVLPGAYDLLPSVVWSPVAADAGDTVTLEVSVVNQGPGAASGFVADLDVPAGFVYVSDTASAGAYDDATGLWTVADPQPMAGLETLTVTLNSPGGGSGVYTAQATLAAQSGETVPGNDTANADITLTSLTDLAVTAAFDVASAQPGDTVELTIDLVNNGPSTAVNFATAVTLPAALTFQSFATANGSYDDGTGVWTSSTPVVALAGATLTISALVTGNDAGTGTANATVTGSGTDPDGSNDNASADLDLDGAYDLVPTVDWSAASANAGDTVSVTVSVANQGPGTAPGFVADLDLPAGFAYVSDAASLGTYDDATGLWTVVDPQPMASLETLTVTLVSPAAGDGVYTAQAVLAAQVGEIAPLNDTASADLTLSSVADLGITAAFDVANAQPGDTVELTVDLVNNGPSTAADFTAPVTLPTALAYQSSATTNGTYDDGTGTWTSSASVAALAGETLTITMLVSGNDAEDVSATATVTGSSGDPVGANNTTNAALTLDGAYDLIPTVAWSPSAANAGDTVTLEVSVANQGPGAALGFVADLDVPAGFVYVSDTASAGTYDDATGLWTVVDPQAMAGSETLTVTVVSPAEGDGAFTAQATLTAQPGDTVPGNDTASGDITLGAVVDLAVAAAFDAAGAQPGDTVQLTIDLTNNGPGTATSFTALVTLPGALSYQSSAMTNGTYDDGTGTWESTLPIAALAAEALTITALVTGNDAGLVSAAVSATGSEGDPDTDNNAATADLDLVGAFDLTAAVNFEPPAASAGDTVSAFIVIDNLGPGQASGADVTVDVPVEFTQVSQVATAGSYDAGARAWTIATALGVAAPETLTIRLAMPADGDGDYTVSAAIAAQAGEQDPSNDLAREILNLGTDTDLELMVTADPTVGWPNDRVDLTFAVTNLGPGVATGMTVSATVPPELQVVAQHADVDIHDDVRGVWTITDPLPVGETYEIRLTTRIVEGATGDLVTTATVTADGTRDPDLDNNTNTATVTIGDPPEITVTTVPFDEEDRTIWPGGPLVDVLRLRLTNDGGASATLTDITFTNLLTGVADQATQDGFWSSLELRAAAREPVTLDGFTDGTVTASGLNLIIGPGASLDLTLRGAIGTTVTDGIVLQISLDGDTNLQFGGPVTLLGDWPLTPLGVLWADGMSSAQIVLHPVGDDDNDILQVGSVRNLALDVTLPANGTLSDELVKLNVINEGTAPHTSVLTRFEVWQDDGNGVFNAALDTWIGEMHWTGGDRYEISEQTLTVPTAGVRIYVTVDIAEDALGGTVRLSLPAGDDPGVGMLSGNDGPVDQAVTNPIALSVSSTDKFVVTTSTIVSRPVMPGESAVPLLTLLARNLYDSPRTLRQLRVHNFSTGVVPTDQATIDGAIAQLLLQRDGDGDGQRDGIDIDPVLASTTWEDGMATFDGIQWELAADELAALFLTATVSESGAADGDVLGAVVGAVADLQFEEDVSVVAAWPLDSGAQHAVDGMVAVQIVAPAVPPVSLTANEGPVLAFDMTVPSNGYLDDTLQSLRLVNLGTALPADIAAMGLWTDDDDNGVFEPGADSRIATLTGIDRDWVALDLDLALPVGGRRLFAGLTVTDVPTDSSTVRLSVPVDGLVVASDNDGPHDEAVESPTSLLISTAPLLSNFAFAIPRSTTEMTTTLIMDVHNVGGEGINGITPQDLALSGVGGATVASGPVPASLDLADGEAGSFTWVIAGYEAGTVAATGRCEGLSAVGGQVRGSLASQSGNHRVLDPALDLSLFPVVNMPFSINRGQTGVVPLTLTLANDGGEERAEIRLERLVITLDDGDENPVVPSDLLSRVTVNEGVNVYCDVTMPETSGQLLTLALDPVVVVTASEPVTLGLRLDIRSDTPVDRFRVSLMSASDVTVRDHVSEEPRSVNLTTGTFPVRSAAGSVVSQATGLVVHGVSLDNDTAGAGQDGVELLRLSLAGLVDDEGSEVKVGGFAVSLADAEGRRMADSVQRLSRMWVEGPLAVHAIEEIDDVADSLVVFSLTPQITVPVGLDQVTVSVRGRVEDDPVLGSLRLQLEDVTTFDARDGNTSAAVSVSYDPLEITGPEIIVQEPATDLQLAVTGHLPPVLSQGARDVTTLSIAVVNPGLMTNASVVVDSLRLTCLDADRQPVDPASILDGYRVTWNDNDVGAPVVFQGSELLVPMAGRVIAPSETVTIGLHIDIEADAPATGLEIVVNDSCLVARDVNLLHRVGMTAAAGAVLPAGSGLARLQPASDEVLVTWTDRLPPLLATDGTAVEAFVIALENPAAPGSAPVQLSMLDLRATTRDRQPLAAGAVFGSAEIHTLDGTWATISDVADTDSTLAVLGDLPLTVDAGATVELTVLVTPRADATVDGIRLGLRDGDILCLQPGSSTVVPLRPDAGLVFPFWTAAAGLGAGSLEDSYINFPNPFAAGRQETSFAFQLPQAGHASLLLWTPRGEAVATLFENRPLAAGLHQDLTWDGRNGRGKVVRNGVYLAELRVTFDDGGSERLLRKVAVVR